MITIGVDVGQKVDPTAICVAEHQRRDGREHVLIRHLARMPLGTPYPEVADEIAKVTRRVEARTGGRPRVYVDATGVGQPIVDLLAERRVAIIPVYFTHGDRRAESRRPGGRRQVSLGKAYMVSRLQAMLQTQRIHLPRTREAQALAGELQDYEIRVDENANERYGAFRAGAHDDLVTALGLAVVQGGNPAGRRR